MKRDKSKARIIKEKMMQWRKVKYLVGGSNMYLRYDTMAKLQTLKYLMAIEDLANDVLDVRPDILPSAIPKLVEEVKQAALLHACAVLSCGFVKRWRLVDAVNYIPEIAQNIRSMSIGVAVSGTHLSQNMPLSEQRAWQLDSQHKMTTNWAISIDDWSVTVATLAYTIARNVMTVTEGLETFLEGQSGQLFFSPHRIIDTGNPNCFTFEINVHNRELLPSLSELSQPAAMGF